MESDKHYEQPDIYDWSKTMQKKKDVLKVPKKLFKVNTNGTFTGCAGIL